MRGSWWFAVLAVVGVGQSAGAGCDYPALPVIGSPASDASVDAALMPPMMGLSCQGLPATCGPSGTDNCCNVGRAVIGGTYYRSADLAGQGDQSAPATVSTFWLDKYEVTVGRFRAFVNAGKGTQASPPVSGAGAHARIANSGWNTSWNAILSTTQVTLIAAMKCNAIYQTWTDSPSGNEARPMNCITWYEAMAFCIWDGGYLPTEAEWNYAATGGSQQRAYPWSSPAESLTLTASHASYYDGTNCVGDGAPGCALADFVQVGSKPLGDGRWGQSELAGNVWEWILDWYVNSHATSCVDCAQVGGGAHRVIRGGGYSNSAFYLRTGGRSNFNPTVRDVGLGVRCARAP